MVNFPVFFTSAVASCTKLSTSPATDFLSRPVLSTKADVIPLFGMAVTAFFFITFIAFASIRCTLHMGMCWLLGF